MFSILNVCRTVGFVCLATSILVAAAQGQLELPGFAFQGRALVAVSDTDMLSSAYTDSNLGPDVGPDTLSVIRLDRPPTAMHAATVEASNSVVGPPAAVAITPDGRYAIVIETRGSRPEKKADATTSDLAKGGSITVFDLSDLDRPHLVQRVQGSEDPSSVSVSADGTLVAIAYGPNTFSTSPDAKPSPLVIYRFGNGRLSEPVMPNVPVATPGDTLVLAQFSPRENILALVYGRQPTLVFVRVAQTDAGVALTAYGEPVEIDRSPFQVQFTPNGRHLLVNAFPSGAGVLGTVASVRIAQSASPDGTPLHSIVSRVTTGLGPEGLSVSPNGRWVVTTNLENSFFAPSDSRQTFYSSLTLIRLDPATGTLERVNDYPFDGVLPEAAVFDNSSRFLAVVNHGRFDNPRAGGSVDFWRLAGDPVDPRRVNLVKTNYSVAVARGPHSIVIAR